MPPAGRSPNHDYNTLLTSTLQSNVPGDTLGRASATTEIGSTILVPAGMGLAGILAAALGTLRSQPLATKLGMSIGRQVHNPILDRGVDVWQLPATPWTTSAEPAQLPNVS